jgi:putative FmdB family regulatory protein
MPIYPYICQSCDYEFDRLQKLSEDPLKVCPECGAESLRKKLTSAAFHLKGTGWYETDFKNKHKKDDKKAEQKDDGKDAAQKSGGGQPEASAKGSKSDGTSSTSDQAKSSKSAPAESA